MKTLLSGILLFSICCVARTGDKDKIWSLEHDYWRYVKAGDMTSYRTLWHANFVGWPNSSPAPARKAHITDWYDNIVRKGLTMKSWELEPVEFQLTEPVAVTHYRLRYVWVDRAGKEENETFRVHHTWLRVGDGWQIIAGMSAATNANGK